MSNYHFRVRFRLPEHFAFNFEKSTLDIRLPSGRGICTLTTYGEESMKEAQWLLVKDAGDGFPTEEEAAEAGRRVKTAILWSGAKMRMGSCRRTRLMLEATDGNLAGGEKDTPTGSARRRTASMRRIGAAALSRLLSCHAAAWAPLTAGLSRRCRT